MPGTIVALEVEDIRFPTSRELDGSDAMNTDPDYSAAYVVLRTDRGDGIEGHGLTFTTGRGTELCVAAVEALAPHVVGRSIDGILGDLGGFWRSLVGDTQLRWVGPEKGVIHLATAAIVNAVWDLYAKLEGKPLWRLLVDLPPAEIVARDRLPLPERRPAAEPRPRVPRAPRTDEGRPGRGRPRATGSPPTPPRSAGSAIPTRRSADCAARRWPPGSLPSSRRSGRTSRTISGGRRSSGRRSGPAIA